MKIESKETLEQEWEKFKNAIQCYKILIKQSGIDYLNSLNKKNRSAIFKKIILSSKDPEKIPRLKGSLKNFRKIKTGDLRAIVVVTFNPPKMVIHFIGNRKSIYEKLERKI